MQPDSQAASSETTSRRKQAALTHPSTDSSSEKNISTSNNKMLSTQHHFASLASVLLTLAVLIRDAPASSSSECVCQDRRNVSIGKTSCRDVPRNSNLSHRHRDIGFVGQCLPEIPDANKRACYRTRVMDCPVPGSDKPLSQCTYRSRNENENPKSSSLAVLSENTVFKSPGDFDRKKYRNNDFCIYNVDMSVHEQCQGKHIVVQAAAKTDLKDVMVSDGGRRCLDYIEFDFAPGHYLCGDELKNYTSAPIPSSSFLAVFWTNQKGNKGRFEISVRCTHIPLPQDQSQATERTTLTSQEVEADSTDDYSGDAERSLSSSQ